MKQNNRAIFLLIILSLQFSCNDEYSVQNMTPVSTITSPENGAMIQQGETVLISAKVEDIDAGWVILRLYIDGTFIDSLSNFPHSVKYFSYDFQWPTASVLLGNHIIKIIAVDEQHATSESKVIVTLSKGWESGKVVDIDGNSYNTVLIGNQEWMAENLRAVHYPNGPSIPYVETDFDWDWLANTDEAYCFQRNDSNNIYGALYTYTTSNRVCPTGWHLPGNAEWNELEDYLSKNGHNGSEGSALKAKTGWDISSQGTDDYGFSALPGGSRLVADGRFEEMGTSGYWWSATEKDNNSAYLRSITSNDSLIHQMEHLKGNGYSVRCVRDN